MTLVYGSLRRLEGGQADILKAIEAIKNWPPSKVQAVRRCLHEGNSEPLERGLRQSGLKPEAVDVAIDVAMDYVDSPPKDQALMERQVRSHAMMHPDPSSYRPTDYPHSAFHDSFGLSYGFPPSLPSPPSQLYRRKSSSGRRPRPTFHVSEEVDKHYNRDIRDEHLSGSRRDTRYPSYDEDTSLTPADYSGPRRSPGTAKAPPRSPLLVVPDTGPRRRPASYHSSSDRRERSGLDVDSEYERKVIIIQDPPRKHRSSSQRSDRSNRDRRDSSTHSYVRRRSSSRGKEGEETGERIRLVKKMDRIDSIPPQGE